MGGPFEHNMASGPEVNMERSQNSFIRQIAPFAVHDMQQSGILASVTIAQAVLESGYGTSELARRAKNLFGMKVCIFKNCWSSDWNGKQYRKKSWQQDSEGLAYPVLSSYRCYPSIEASIRDHSNYLSSAKKGTCLRFAGLIGEENPATAISILRSGGYSNDILYMEKLLSLVYAWNLQVYDRQKETYRIRQTWNDIESQLGSYHSLRHAKASCPSGYSIYNSAGSAVYQNTLPSPDSVSVTDLLTPYRKTESCRIKRNAIQYIVLHDTKMPDTDAGKRAFCHQQKYFSESVHYCIGFSGEIYRLVKDTDIAWQFRARKYRHPLCRNTNSIGIELCCRKINTQTRKAYDSDWYLEEKTLSSAQLLIRQLLKQYQIPPNNVLRHFDVTGKICPAAFVHNETAWRQFLEPIGYET